MQWVFLLELFISLVDTGGGGGGRTEGGEGGVGGGDRGGYEHLPAQGSDEQSCSVGHGTEQPLKCDAGSEQMDGVL